MRATTACGLGVLGVVLFGCASDESAVESSQTPPVAATESSVDPQVQVELKSWDEVQAWVAGQRGKVVVVDIWSTYCPSCLREFPGFVELNRKYGDQLAGASLSVDFYGGEGESPEDVLPAVQRVLETQKATMRNFVSTDSDEAVLKQVQAVAIPVVLVYDREGRLHTAFNNDSDEYGPTGFTYEENIEPLVKQLLGRAGG